MFQTMNDEFFHGKEVADLFKDLENGNNVPETVKLTKHQHHFIWNGIGGMHEYEDGVKIINEDTDERGYLAIDVNEVYRLCVDRAYMMRTGISSKDQYDWQEIHTWERIKARIEKAITKFREN